MVRRFARQQDERAARQRDAVGADTQRRGEGGAGRQERGEGAQVKGRPPSTAKLHSSVLHSACTSGGSHAACGRQ
jgi:hypothetical protein